LEKKTPAERPDEKQKLHGSKARISRKSRLESWNVVINLLVAAED